MEEINIEDFAKVDLRVARVKEALEVPEANKLIKLILDVGDLGEKTVFAGIKQAYNLQDLQDKLVVVVNNLKPRQMSFGLSEGMILAAGPGGEDVFMISPLRIIRSLRSLDNSSVPIPVGNGNLALRSSSSLNSSKSHKKFKFFNFIFFLTRSFFCPTIISFFSEFISTT